MKIAVLTSGILPIPAILGGAVEHLIDSYLEYNQQKKLHNITIYSIANKKTDKPDTLYNKYYYIDVTSSIAKLKRKFFHYFHSTFYYNYHIEYFFNRALKHIQKSDYDIIILENRPGYAIPLSRVSKAKIILHLHNDLLNKDTPKNYQIHNVCHQIITVSEFIKQQVDSIGLPSKSITVHNGIDIKHFQQPRRNIIREDLGFNNNDFIVVYSGRINKEKGVKELIKSFSNLKNYPHIKLLIIGGVFFGNEPRKDLFIQSLQNEVNEKQLPVKFTGFISYEQIPSYLSIADIAVIPSLWDEPFGLTCVEAMASGLPIIAANSGGIPEICSGCAILVDKNNLIDEISSQILLLSRDFQKRLEMIKAGKENCKKYDKDKYAYLFFKTIHRSTGFYQSSISRPSTR